MIYQINEHSQIIRKTAELKNRSARRAAKQTRVVVIVTVIMFVVIVNAFLAHRDPSNARLNAIVAQAAARADVNAEEKGLVVR